VRRDADGWLGFVCYAESAGLRWLEWVAAERVRPAEWSRRDPALPSGTLPSKTLSRYVVLVLDRRGKGA
jgi:hypothetical protein